MRWVFLEQTSVNLQSDSWILAHRIGKCIFIYVSSSSFKGNSFFWKCNMEFCEISFVKVRWRVCVRGHMWWSLSSEGIYLSFSQQWELGAVCDSAGDWWIYKLRFIRTAMRFENAEDFLLYFCLKEKKKKTKVFFLPGSCTLKDKTVRCLCSEQQRSCQNGKMQPKELFTENQSCWGLLAVKICWNLHIILVFLI